MVTALIKCCSGWKSSKRVFHTRCCPWTDSFRIYKSRFCKYNFSPFAAVSLCRVAGLVNTFPSLTVSGPFLPDAPRFHVSPDRICPPQLRSSSRALPLHLHFDNYSDVLGFISSFDVPEPFQHSPSHNRRYWFHLRFLQDLLIPPVFQQALPLPIAPFSSL